MNKERSLSEEDRLRWGDTRACCSFGGVKSRHTCGGASTPGTAASQMQLAESGNVHGTTGIAYTDQSKDCDMWTVDGGWLSSVARKESCSLDDSV